MKMIEFTKGGGQESRNDVVLRGHCHRGFLLRESDPWRGQDPREHAVREKCED